MAVPVEPTGAICKRHPKVSAGWHCKTCKADICAECTARVVTFYYCCECSQRAQQLTRHRSHVPFSSRLGEALTYPLWRGLKWLIPTALLLTLLSSGLTLLLDRNVAATSQPPSALVIPSVRTVLTLLLVFVVVVSTARRGRTENGVFAITAKFLAAVVIVLLPGVLYFLAVRRAPPDLGMLRDKTLWLLAALGIVYVPAATAGAASDAAFLDVLNPFKVFDWAARAGRRYVATVASVAVLACVACGMAFYAARIRSTVQIPIVGDVLAELVAICLLVAMARIIGSLLYVDGEAFDWGSESDYQDPILVGVDAKGTYRPPVVVGADGQPQAGTGSQTSTSVRPKTEKELAKQIHTALLDDNTQRAVRTYLERPTWDAKLFDQNQLFTMGTAALRSKNFLGAVRLLVAASESRGPNVARALLALGQAYADGLKNTAKATETFQLIVDKHPQSDAAKLAAQRLGGAADPVKI